MGKEFSSSASWNNAAVAGFVMAAVTIAMELIKGWSGMAGGFLGVFLNLMASIAKIFICVILFRYLMKRFAERFSEVTYPRLQRYGMKLALFSSILCAAFALYQALQLNPDDIRAAVEESAGQFSSMLDSNTEATLERMFPKLPAITFFMMFVYCFIWGWTLSTLFARNFSSPTDPFGDPFDGNDQSIDNQ